jgi:large subunit ribosomal protein L35
MPKNKPHKGLLKRVRVTKSGKIKMHRAFGRHLRSHKSGQTIRGYRRPTFAHASDLKRVSRLLGLKTGGRNKARTPDAETPENSSKDTDKDSPVAAAVAKDK